MPCVFKDMAGAVQGPKRSEHVSSVHGAIEFAMSEFRLGYQAYPSDNLARISNVEIKQHPNLMLGHFHIRITANYEDNEQIYFGDTWPNKLSPAEGKVTGTVERQPKLFLTREQLTRIEEVEAGVRELRSLVEAQHQQLATVKDNLDNAVIRVIRNMVNGPQA